MRDIGFSAPLKAPESLQVPHLLRSLSVVLVVLVFVAASVPIPAVAWSVIGHQLITKYAIESLPSSPWRQLFGYYSWFLTDAVTYPDVYYRGIDPREGARHYVDLEVWNPKDPSTGTLPQAVEEFGSRMQLAIEAKDWNSALLYAGRIAHYVEDDTQPYHTTVNYDPISNAGVGLHAVLDSSMVNHWSEIHITPPSDSMTPIGNLTIFALNLAIQSHSFLSTINQTLINEGLNWSPELTKIIENRTNTAITAVARVWYTVIVGAKSSPPDMPMPNRLSIVFENSLPTNNGLVATRLRVVDSLGVSTYADVTLRAASATLRGQVTNVVPPIGEYVIVSETGLQPNDSITAQREGYVAATVVIAVDTTAGDVVSQNQPITSLTSSQTRSNVRAVPDVTIIALVLMLAAILALMVLRKTSKNS